MSSAVTDSMTVVCWIKEANITGDFKRRLFRKLRLFQGSGQNRKVASFSYAHRMVGAVRFREDRRHEEAVLPSEDRYVMRAGKHKRPALKNIRIEKLQPEIFSGTIRKEVRADTDMGKPS